VLPEVLPFFACLAILALTSFKSASFTADKLMRCLIQAKEGNNDGLLQRLQLAVYPDEPKNWVIIGCCSSLTLSLFKQMED
jgi:hypothetical protein